MTARQDVTAAATTLLAWVDEEENEAHLNYLTAAWNAMQAGGNSEIGDARRVVKAALTAIAEREEIGTCASCLDTIYEGQKHHTCAGGEPIFCEACAPMLSEILSQYEEVLKAPQWEPGELDFETPKELAARIEEMRAEIAKSGDRKAVWS